MGKNPNIRKINFKIINQIIKEKFKQGKQKNGEKFRVAMQRPKAGICCRV